MAGQPNDNRVPQFDAMENRPVTPRERTALTKALAGHILVTHATPREVIVRCVRRGWLKSFNVHDLNDLKLTDAQRRLVGYAITPAGRKVIEGAANAE
jgi:hypothetical protein